MDRTYEDGRIRVLDKQLRAAGLPEETVDVIMEGGEGILKGSKPGRKAAWFKGAMQRMEASLDYEACREIREGCACCLGGKRLEVSRSIARGHETLDDRLAAANEARFVFGHSVTRQDDGRILVRFEEEGKPSYRCVCLKGAEGSFPAAYCICCGGHVKHHLQIALGHRLECTVRATALTSAGTEPCSFLFRIVD